MRWNPFEALMAKKARLGLISVFCKILDSYPVFCYVKEKSCNKNHFELFNTV